MQLPAVKQFATRPWFFVVTLLLIIVLHYSTILRPIENLVVTVIQPAQTIMYQSTTSAAQASTGGQSIKNPEELQHENQLLQKEVERLTIENAHLKTVVSQAQLLKKQENFLKERSFQAATATVTSRSSDGLAQSIVVNKGAADGIHVGLPAITENGILVGTIQSVSDHSAQLLLLTSYDSLVSGVVQNKEQSPGVVRGEHTISLRMDFLPQPDSISIGEAVLSNGNDPFIPVGLAIGQVQEVVNEPGSLFQYALLQAFFDPSEISVVSILIP